MCQNLIDLYFLRLTVFKSLQHATNVTAAYLGGSALIACPFVSVPPANVTWWFEQNGTRIEDGAFNRRVLTTYKRNALFGNNLTLLSTLLCRFYQMTDGNLLIVEIVAEDAIPYRYVTSIQLLEAYLTLGFLVDKVYGPTW